VYLVVLIIIYRKTSVYTKSCAQNIRLEYTAIKFIEMSNEITNLGVKSIILSLFCHFRELKQTVSLKLAVPNI